MDLCVHGNLLSFYLLKVETFEIISWTCAHAATFYLFIFQKWKKLEIISWTCARMATFSLLSFKSGKNLRLSHGPVRAWQPSHSNFICSPDLYCRENFTNIHSGVYGSVFWYSTLLEGSVICIRRPPDRRPPPLNPQVTILSFSPSAVCS